MLVSVVRSHSLALADQVQGLIDPRAVMAASAQALGEHRGVSRVGLGEVQPDGATVVRGTGYANGVGKLAGTFDLEGFGAHSIARNRQGLAVVQDDVTHDPTSRRGPYACREERRLLRDDRLPDHPLRKLPDHQLRRGFTECRTAEVIAR